MLQLQENRFLAVIARQFYRQSNLGRTGKDCFALLAITLIIFILTFLGKAYAQEPILAPALIEENREYDGKIVTFQGEAIGDKMPRRGKGVWVNMLDSSGTALGVWLTPQQAQFIKILGCYNYKGDVVQVTGVFNRACAEHMGEIDLHAASVRIITPGEPTKHPVSFFRLQLALGLLLLACLLIFIWKRYFKPVVEAKKY